MEIKRLVLLTPFVNQTNLVTHSYEGSYTNVNVLVNGTKESHVNNTRGSSSNGYQSLTIGRLNNSTTDHFGNFEIAEVIVISSTDSQKIIEIQNYLSNKWNLTQSIDSDSDGLVDAKDTEPKTSNLAYHIEYNSSESNGNRYLALPNSTVFDTPYPYSEPDWVDDTINGTSVKVMDFSSGNQWMLVDDNGERLSMPGTYDGWTVSMWLK